MKTAIDGNLLTIFLEGRIDTDTAPKVEKECRETLAKEPHSSVCLDLENLEYVSSSGLRMILGIKKTEPSLTVINVQRDVYDIFEMTGFTQMMEISRAMRKISVDGCKVIGKGAVGTVYRYLDDMIVKVYKSDTTLKKIYAEKNKAQRAFTLGIPTAISFDVVKVGDSYGTIYEMLNANTMSTLIKENPDKLGEYAKEFSDVLKTIHNAEAAEGELPTAQKMFADPMLSYLKKNVDAETKKHIVELVNAIPPSQNIIHGDYHTNNLLMQNDEPMLIDMDKLACGNKIFELSSIYSTYVTFGLIDNDRVKKFMGFDYSVAVKFYEYFIKAYFDDKSEQELKDIQKKISLLAYLRHLRHAANHIEDEEMQQKNMAMCAENLVKLSKEVDSLAL